MSQSRLLESLTALFTTHGAVFWHDLDQEFTALMEGRTVLDLAEGLQLHRARVMSAHRIELSGFTDTMRDRLRAASTDFQDSKDASRGLKPKRVDVSNAAVDVARVVETLGPVTLLIKQDGHEPLPGAAPLSMAELREQAGLKLEIARASLEIGRALVARTLLAAVQREGDAAERQAADELMLKLA